jgi:FixJ family two-component response regulator
LASNPLGEDWVAIVDDDESIRRSLSRIFILDGVSVRTFSSAEDYLGRTCLGEPCCMVLDVQLGGINGFELQDRLRDEGRAPPIIFITALDAIPAAQLACRSSQGGGFLRKPFNLTSLLDLVRPHIRSASGFQLKAASVEP